MNILDQIEQMRYEVLSLEEVNVKTTEAILSLRKDIQAIKNASTTLSKGTGALEYLQKELDIAISVLADDLRYSIEGKAKNLVIIRKLNQAIGSLETLLPVNNDEFSNPI